MKLRRITNEALKAFHTTPELKTARPEMIPTFTDFLDLPLVMIISLGPINPATWTHFMIGTILADFMATGLTLVLLKLYPWNTSTD